MFNKYNFKIIDFATKKQNNPEITGIYFNSKKETIATDSITLIRLESPDLDSKDFPILPDKSKALKAFKPFILSPEGAKKILKVIPEKNASLPILENTILVEQKENMVDFATTDLESFNRVKTRTIIGDFPDYKKMLTKNGKHIKVSVNVKYLKKIVNFLDSFNDNTIDKLDFEIPFDTNNQPIRFYGDRNGQKCEVLLMSIRQNH